MHEAGRNPPVVCLRRLGQCRTPWMPAPPLRRNSSRAIWVRVFRSVRDTLAHIMGAQWIWLERFHGRSPTGLPKADQYPDLASLRARWAEIERDLLALC